MITVKTLLQTKPSQALYEIGPDQTTYEALQVMADHNIGCVAVREEGRLIGLLTERDYARRIVLEGKKSRNTPVRETMNPDFYPIDEHTTIEECMTKMTEKRARYLPVMREGKLVAVLSIGDVVNSLIKLQDANIEFLERMVTGQEYGS
ncbi:MAG: CBS domain-containing protein [Opitutales bacterium]|nr:CBS domain-containing protein [Opitutales bacterium]MCH8540806.1 CBS domain-containing protein [Opitutales bacterium]